MIKKCRLLFILFLSIPFSIFSQETAVELLDEEPSWLLYEKGMERYREGELGEAMSFFRQILRQEDVYPEAEAALAMVFEAEGEYLLAEKYYQSALSEKDSFYIEDDYFYYRYRLAKIYQRQKMYKEYRENLEMISREDPFFAEANAESQLDQFRRILVQEGLDRLLTLYRLEDNFTSKAHSELGILFIGMGRYNPALEQLTLVVLRIFSTAIEEYLSYNPSYRFENTRQFLSLVDDNEIIMEYFSETELFKNLYYLAAAAYGEQLHELALELWRLVYDESWNTSYQRMAELQLESPHLEPLIFYPQQ